MIESGTLLQNRYLIEKQIGEGGMGAVYVAIDQRFGSHVAIKETFYKDDVLGEAFEREAHLLNSLHHPALPHVSDFFAENNGYFLVMQFIEGEDLYEILKREGVFPVKDVLRWTDDLLDALDYLHSQEPPIIHRDIKPQNLKITTRGDIILLDFGLAKLNMEDSGMKSIFGYSRKYSPLEQIQGTGTDARSDLFALAATAYHLLTSKPPIEVITRASEIVNGNPDPLQLASEINKEVPIDVASVLNSALALNADRRFVSAKAMRQALEHAVNAIPTESQARLLPEPIPAVVVSDNQFIKQPEIENFTALESFAADAANNLPLKNKDEKLEPIEIPVPDTLVSLPEPEVVPQKIYIGEKETKIAPPAQFFRFRLAAMAGLLICSVLAGLYFITRTSSSSDSSQPPVAQSNEEPNSDGGSSPILKTPKTKTVDAAMLENGEQEKTKSSANEKNIEKKETINKSAILNETTETANLEPSVAEIPPPPPLKKQPRNQTRQPVTSEQPAPDIESIFTGGASEQPDKVQPRRDERKQERDDWSEEELREMRRQRKQERRQQRQNDNTIPF